MSWEVEGEDLDERCLCSLTKKNQVKTHQHYMKEKYEKYSEAEIQF